MVLWPGQSLPELFLLSVLLRQYLRSIELPAGHPRLDGNSTGAINTFLQGVRFLLCLGRERHHHHHTPLTLRGTHFPLNLPFSHFPQPVSGAILELSEPPLPSPVQLSGALFPMLSCPTSFQLSFPVGGRRGRQEGG